MQHFEFFRVFRNYHLTQRVMHHVFCRVQASLLLMALTSSFLWEITIALETTFSLSMIFASYQQLKTGGFTSDGRILRNQRVS